MGQLKDHGKLDMEGLQVFWYFYLLGNWPVRYVRVVKELVLSRLPLICLILVWLTSRCMLTLKFTVAHWGWCHAVCMVDLHTIVKRLNSREGLI